MKLVMNNSIGKIIQIAVAAAFFGCGAAHVRSADTNAPIFSDPNLEKAVRKYVFEKRDTDKPLVEADVVNLSTIQGNGMGVTNLAGLEKCQNLASLDLAKNKITDLQPLKTLVKIQYLNLAD